MTELHPQGFRILLQALAADADSAGERYEMLRLRLHRFFGYRGHPRPEELTDETLDRITRRLGEGEKLRSPDPGPFALGVARNVLREAWARDRREEALLDPPETAAPEDDADGDHATVLLAPCLDRLPSDQRRLVLDYYAGHHGSQIPVRQALASSLGIGLNALRIRVHRIRAAIENCLRRRNDEMEAVSGPRHR